MIGSQYAVNRSAHIRPVVQRLRRDAYRNARWDAGNRPGPIQQSVETTGRLTAKHGELIFRLGNGLLNGGNGRPGLLERAHGLLKIQHVAHSRLLLPARDLSGFAAGLHVATDHVELRLSSAVGDIGCRDIPGKCHLGRVVIFNRLLHVLGGRSKVLQLTPEEIDLPRHVEGEIVRFAPRHQTGALLIATLETIGGVSRDRGQQACELHTLSPRACATREIAVLMSGLESSALTMSASSVGSPNRFHHFFSAAVSRLPFF